MTNSLKTTLFLGFLTGLLLFIGKLIGGNNGIIIALIFAGVMNFASYWWSDKIVLAMFRAKKIPEGEMSWLHSIIERLSQKGGIPKPALYYVPNPSPNAFATGRSPKHGAVAVTDGLLKLLNREEIEGVIAHELSHIKNRDTLISAVAATIAGAIMVLADMARWAMLFGGIGSRNGRDRDENPFALLFLVILAPIAAMLIQMAISRSREYEADASAANIAGNPYGLASALKKLSEVGKRIPIESSPATSHLFIVNPLSARSILNLFSTHPPVEKRIERLIGRSIY